MTCQKVNWSDWRNLDDQRWVQAVCHLDLLVDEAFLLGGPQVRQLAEQLRLYFGDRVWSVPDRISAVEHHADGARHGEDGRAC